MAESILLVDDEATALDMLAWSLTSEGYAVAMAASGEEALALLEADEFDLVIADIIMSGLSGFDVLTKTRILSPRTQVMLTTAFATVETAVEALRQGACDYVVKPWALDDLKARVRHLMEYRAAFHETRFLQRAIAGGVETLRGEGRAVSAVRAQISRIGPKRTNVLITGESGTGKDLAARAIHAASPRREQPFVPVNCGAIPDALLESQLFGHVRGAFTSAEKASPGLFVVADRGTIFLDEIGDLPLHLQVKLLRVIEEQEVWSVGAIRPVRVDVRIVASTNRPLERDVENGRFREDLFYRLNVIRIGMPPLRDRREDVPLLVDHFIRDLNLKLSTRYLGVDREAMRALVRHPWKGNVRELLHVLESAMILGDGTVICARHLPAEMVPAAAGAAAAVYPLKDAALRFERQHILDILKETRFDKHAAARLLGISLASLYRKLGQRWDNPGS